MQYDDREEAVSYNYVSSERFVLIEVSCFEMREGQRLLSGSRKPDLMLAF
jgi:hypothetical protein